MTHLLFLSLSVVLRYNYHRGEKRVKRQYISIIILLAMVTLLFSIFIIRSCNREGDNPSSLPLDSNVVDWSGNQQLPNGSSSTGKICIPGFDSLVFVANQTSQKVNFYNPAVNGDRLFKMTLYIDYKPYWMSGYCPSGSGYYDIELTEPIVAGEYSAYLQIECFKPDGSQLNGARVTFNLKVTEEKAE